MKPFVIARGNASNKLYLLERVDKDRGSTIWSEFKGNINTVYIITPEFSSHGVRLLQEFDSLEEAKDAIFLEKL